MLRLTADVADLLLVARQQVGEAVGNVGGIKPPSVRVAEDALCLVVTADDDEAARFIIKDVESRL